MSQKLVNKTKKVNKQKKLDKQFKATDKATRKGTWQVKKKQRPTTPTLQMIKDKKPVYVMKSPCQESLYQSIVKVTPDWNVQAFQEMYAVMCSYFLARNVGVSQQQNLDLQSLYNGLLYQFIGMSDEIAGKPSLTKRLRIVHDIISAFMPKEITTHKFYKNSYAWNAVQAISNGDMITAYNAWRPLLIQPDDSTYLSPATPYTPIADLANYQQYLNLVKAVSSARAQQLEAVESEDSSVLSGDVSAFAKVYTYCGLNPSGSGGFYNDIESEVNITAPVLSHNVLYNTTIQDTRVPRKLTTNEGGPGTMLAPLIQGYDSWFNKCPISFKFLDLFEVVNTLLYWYVGLAIKASEERDEAISNYSFPFSYQDFVIVVRQAILTAFKDQFLGQFVGPLAYDSSSTNFTPLQVLANCYGADSYNRLNVPSMMAENMSLLQTQIMSQPGRKSKINKTMFVPVWGFYNDIQPVWTIPTPSTTVPLFADIPQKTINLVDCSYNGNSYVNVNSAYYQAVFEGWNNKITVLKDFTNVADLSNLTPPSTCFFLQMTRVNSFQTEQQRAITLNKTLPFPALKPIANLVAAARVKDTDSKRSSLPLLPRPTDVQFINEVDRFSMFPVPKEVHDFCNYLVLPSIRLDPASPNDILNNVMYQTLTGEGLHMPQIASSNAPGYLNRQLDAANMCIEGLGKIHSSNLSLVLQTLTEHGDGGVLASLLGGVAKSVFPGASGFIDSIASVVPI